MKRKILLTVLLIIIITGIGVWRWDILTKNTSTRFLTTNTDDRPEVKAMLETLDKTQKVDTSSWKTYRDELLGFEIKYPSDWIPYTNWMAFAKDKEDWRTVWLKDFYPKNIFQHGSVIYFFNPKNNNRFAIMTEPESTWEYLKKEEDEEVRFGGLGTEIYRRITPADSNIRFADVPARMTGASEECFAVGVTHGGYFYSIAGSSLVSDEKSTVATMFTSLQFIDPTNDPTTAQASTIEIPTDPEILERAQKGGFACDTLETQEKRKLAEKERASRAYYESIPEIQKRTNIGTTTEGDVFYIKSASSTAHDPRVYANLKNGSTKEILGLKDFSASIKTSWSGTVSPLGNFALLVSGKADSGACCRYDLYDLNLKGPVEWLKDFHGDKSVAWASDESFVILNTSVRTFGGEPPALYLIRLSGTLAEEPQLIISSSYNPYLPEETGFRDVYIENNQSVVFTLYDYKVNGEITFRYDIQSKSFEEISSKSL